jgi:hypothetical protein
MRWLVPILFFAQSPAPPDLKTPPPAPPQPIPYSHRAHIKLGLECKTCHTMPDPGEFATLPDTATCMTCHGSVLKESPHIQKLAGWHAGKQPVPWRRVYRIPDYVFFSHREHTKEFGCETCHGPVAERDVMRKEKDISMAGCMDCHRATQASLACNYCHEQRGP